MKFKALIKHADGGQFWENFDEDLPNLEEATKWIKKIVDNFNGGLRPGESCREFVSIELVKETKVKPMVFENPMTYKHYKCPNCIGSFRSSAKRPTCTHCGFRGKMGDMDKFEV